MLISMKQAGILSTKTAIEKNTESTPDEAKRIEEENAANTSVEKIEEQIDVVE